MAIDLSGLASAVGAATTTADSLLVFVENLKSQLAVELADDPAAQAKVDAFMTELLASKDKMAAAMQANVPPGS